MMHDLGHLRVREGAALMHTYTRQPVAFVRGAGAWLYDGEGRAYLDGLSGLAVTGLGHAHPEVTEAVAGQAATLTHTSNLYYTGPQIALAEGLANTLGWSDARTFFCNSGAEANEAAIKLARLHGRRRAAAAVGVVALSGSFHGRTLAALRVTGDPAKHRPFEPLGDWVRHVPFDDADALADAVDDRTSAVLLEVVQGEGGVREVPPDVLRAARESCDRVGALLIVDEVQTGLGRLGSWYGWQTALGGQPVRPDVVCLAKGLANGLPIGAIVAHGEAAKVFEPGHHASTFGGGPVVCAAASAVLGVIDRDGLVERAERLGTRFGAQVDALADDQPLVAGHRGRGLLRAVALTRPVASAVVAAALDHGLVVNAVAPDAVRFAPPLILSDAELDQLVERFAAALSDVDPDPPAEADDGGEGPT